MLLVYTLSGRLSQNHSSTSEREGKKVFLKTISCHNYCTNKLAICFHAYSHRMNSCWSINVNLAKKDLNRYRRGIESFKHSCFLKKIRRIKAYSLIKCSWIRLSYKHKILYVEKLFFYSVFYNISQYKDLLDWQKVFKYFQTWQITVTFTFAKPILAKQTIVNMFLKNRCSSLLRSQLPIRCAASRTSGTFSSSDYVWR